MKKFKITNKKIFTAFIFFVLLLVGALSFLIFKIVEFKRVSQNAKSNNHQTISQEGIIKDNIKAEAEAQNAQETEKQTAPVQAYTEYENQQYAYVVTFPDNWFLNSDSAEEKPEVTKIDEKNVSIGGQTFWSNYKNINEFSPDQKPEDFHLLGLTIYESDALNTENFAEILGYDSESILQKNAIEGNGISGIEFVAEGNNEKNPLVVIIFQKNQRFYVFNIGFPNGDAEAAETMENIAKTLILK